MILNIVCVVRNLIFINRDKKIFSYRFYPYLLMVIIGSLSLFMRDVLTNLCGAVSIAPELTEMVEVSLSANAAGDRLVQLVNNSGTFGVSFVKPLPVETINITIPTEEAPSQVCTLNGGTVRWQFSDHLLTLTLDRLDEYDAILIRR